MEDAWRSASSTKTEFLHGSIELSHVSRVLAGQLPFGFAKCPTRTRARAVGACNMIAFCHNGTGEISLRLILHNGASYLLRVRTVVEGRLKHAERRGMVCPGWNRSCRHHVKGRDGLS